MDSVFDPFVVLKDKSLQHVAFSVAVVLSHHIEADLGIIFYHLVDSG